MSLVAVARKLHGVLRPHGILIGGICGVMHGIERFTRNVDLATDLNAEKVVGLLKNEGIDAEIRFGDALDRLSWVIQGVCDDVEFQILSAKDIGIDLSNGELKLGLLIASEKEFIVSKCIAGGQQDLHDVVVLMLLKPMLKDFVMRQAVQYSCQERLQAWLNDERLLSRYGKS